MKRFSARYSSQFVTDFVRMRALILIFLIPSSFHLFQFSAKIIVKFHCKAYNNYTIIRRSSIMKDSKHKLLTLAALTTIAAGVVHVANRVIVASSQLKEMLDFSNHNYYNLLYKKRNRFTTFINSRYHARCQRL